MKINQIINELDVYGDGDPNTIEGKYIFSYKRWVFVGDNWDMGDKLDVINEITGLDIEDVREFADNNPLAIYGEVSSNYLQLEKIGGGNTRHASTSKQLLKIIKQFNLDGVRVYESYGNFTNDDEFQDDREEFLKPLGKKTFYHGTGLSAFNKFISRTGLRPNPEGTNFRNIKHDNKVFITLNYDKSIFYAEKVYETRKDFPIILELNIPDPNQLVLDYDHATEYYTDHDLPIELGYDDIHMLATGRNIFDDPYTSFTQNPDVQEFVNNYRKSPDRLNTNLGVFGYTGRIPASFIKRVILDEDLLRSYIVSEEFGYDDFDLGQMASPNDWSTYTPQEARKLYNEIYDEIQEEFADEDEDDEY